MNLFNSSSKDYEYNPLVAKYEELRQQQKSFYLDPYEFIEIANFYLNQLNYKEAKEALLNGLKIHRLETNLLIELAHLYLELERTDKVKQILQQLEGVHLFEVESIRAEIILMENEDIEQAEQLFLLSVDPVDLDQRLTVAQLFLIYQYPDKALAWLLPLYNDSNHNIEFLDLLVRCYLMNLDFANAAKIYDNLLNLVPYESDYWNKLGHCYYLEEDYEAAEEAYSFTLLCDKKINEPYIFGALSLLYQKKEKEANQLFNNGIKENILLPEDKYYYLALFYYLQEDIERAYKMLIKGIEIIKEKNAYNALCYYFLMTLCLIRLENYDEAYKYCSKGLQIHRQLPNKNTDEPWLIIPTIEQLEDLQKNCKERNCSPTEIQIQYTHQLSTLLNPFLWREKGYSLLTRAQSFNELDETTRSISISKKASEIQNQVEKVSLERLLHNERILAESKENIEKEDNNANFFKNILENNPNLASIWRKEMKNIIQNN